MSLFKANMIFILLLVSLKFAFSHRSGHSFEITGRWSGWTWQWHNFSRARQRWKASLTAWRWKKWHWLNLIPERWHHSHRRGGCVRIGRRPRPIRAHTHGKSLKKIEKSVGKLSTASAAGPSTTATNNSNNNIFEKLKEKKKQKPDTHGFVRDFSVCFPCLGHRAVTCFSIFKALLSSTVNSQNNRMSTHFRSGPAFGLSAEVKSKVGLHRLCRCEVYLQDGDTLWLKNWFLMWGQGSLRATQHDGEHCKQP